MKTLLACFSLCALTSSRFRRGRRKRSRSRQGSRRGSQRDSEHPRRHSPGPAGPSRVRDRSAFGEEGRDRNRRQLRPRRHDLPRRPHYTGRWGAPAMYALEGVSIGFQLGGQATDFVLLVMNPRGAQSLLSSKVKLGADASAAAGPKGRTAEAATDVVMTAEILSYSRARLVRRSLARRIHSALGRERQRKTVRQEAQREKTSFAVAK